MLAGKFVLALIPFLAWSTLAAAETQPVPQGQRQKIEELAEQYTEVLNAQDLDAFPQIFTDDYTNVNPLGTFQGLDTFRALMQGVYASLSGITYTIDELLVDGNRMILRYSYTATHSGDFLGVPATGRVVHGRGMEVSTVVDGKIAFTWNYSDIFGLMAQITAP